MHPIISQLTVVKDNEAVSEKTKAKIAELLQEYGQQEELIPAEENACKKWLDKANSEIETAKQAAEAAEQERIQKEQEEANRAEQERLANEEKQRQEAAKNLVLPHVEVFKKYQTVLSAKIKKKLTGVNLLVSKFQNTPSDSNKKAALKGSQNYVAIIEKFVKDKQTADDDQKRKTKEAEEDRLKKEKEAAEKTAAEQKEKEQEEANRAEQERLANEKKEREGIYGNEYIKGFLGQ